MVAFKEIFDIGKELHKHIIETMDCSDLMILMSHEDFKEFKKSYEFQMATRYIVDLNVNDKEFEFMGVRLLVIPEFKGYSLVKHLAGDFRR